MRACRTRSTMVRIEMHGSIKLGRGQEFRSLECRDMTNDLGPCAVVLVFRYDLTVVMARLDIGVIIAFTLTGSARWYCTRTRHL